MTGQQPRNCIQESFQTVQFAFDGKEYSAEVAVGTQGHGRGACHYCADKAGQAVDVPLIEIKEISDEITGPISPRTQLFKKLITHLNERCLEGRMYCEEHRGAYEKELGDSLEAALNE